VVTFYHPSTKNSEATTIQRGVEKLLKTAIKECEHVFAGSGMTFDHEAMVWVGACREGIWSMCACMYHTVLKYAGFQLFGGGRGRASAGSSTSPGRRPAIIGEQLLV